MYRSLAAASFALIVAIPAAALLWRPRIISGKVLFLAVSVLALAGLHTIAIILSAALYALIRGSLENTDEIYNVALIATSCALVALGAPLVLKLRRRFHEP